MCSKTQNTEVKDNNIPYKHCLNCGSELKGTYCHNCGQQASSPTPRINGFIMEYINNAFLWDTNFIPTIKTLLSRPGRLTNDYLAGKFISQVHPLKLNMFMLFVFITLFLLFSDKEKINNSVITNENYEIIFPSLQLNSLKNDSEYMEKIKQCPRDTVHLLAPLSITTEYPEIISNIETIEVSNDEFIDKWVAVIPHVLIEDQIITHDESAGYYRFNRDIETNNSDLEIMHLVWVQLVQLITKYFPMLVLLTVPFLSLSLRLIQHKDKRPHIHYFIFSLHYTAFLEVLFIFIYILHIIGIAKIIPLEFISIIGSCVYLSLALKNVYKINSLFKAIVKALFISFVYIIICLLILILISLIACIIVAFNIVS